MRATAALIILVAAVAFPLAVPAYYVQFSTKVMILGILAMGLNLAVGRGGLVSMCHGAFYGIAAYTLALLTPKYDPASLWLTLPLAVVAASAAALVIGALSLRTRGVYFIMVTLAFGQMLFYFFHDQTFAGGSDGAYVNVKPEAAIAGVNLLNLDKVNIFYWTVLALTALTVLLLVAIARAPFGAALAAARDNERRARSLGFPIYRLRLTAFVISGAIAGVAGYFAAAQFGYVAPEMLGWHQSAIALVMVVLGGQRSVVGPLIGAAIVMGLEEWLKGLTENWKLIEGLIIIAIVLAFPAGFMALVERVMPAHDPEKWEPVFGEDHAPINKERKDG
jgi:branched-chain amino acid transport system permease protein